MQTLVLQHLSFPDCLGWRLDCVEAGQIINTLSPSSFSWPLIELPDETEGLKKDEYVLGFQNLSRDWLSFLYLHSGDVHQFGDWVVNVLWTSKKMLSHHFREQIAQRLIRFVSERGGRSLSVWVLSDHGNILDFLKENGFTLKDTSVAKDSEGITRIYVRMQIILKRSLGKIDGGEEKKLH
jgi:hypothetical protein